MTMNRSMENTHTRVTTSKDKDSDGTTTVPIQNAYSTRVGTLKGTKAEHIQHLGQGPLESTTTVEQSSNESE